MTIQGATLHTDNVGTPTSHLYGDRGDGTSEWYNWSRAADGADVAQGAKADAAVTDYTAPATVIALLKGLAKLMPVSATSGAVSAIGSSSGNVAAATATATLVAGGAGKTTYIRGFSITGSGATAASVVVATITGLLGGTRSYIIAVPAGATLGITPLIVDFGDGFPAAAANSPIVVSVPSLGAGNTNCAVNVHGFVK